MKWIKMDSIRTKLLFGFSIIVLVMFSVLFLLNQLFIDEFFLYANKVNMVKQSEAINTLGEPIEFREIERKIAKETGGQVFLFEEDRRTPVMTIPTDDAVLGEGPPMMNSPIEGLFEEAQVSEHGVFKLMGMGGTQDQEITYIYQLDNGQFILIKKGLGIVAETRQLFVRFLGISSLLVYFFGFICLYFYADKFTKPIIHLQRVAEKLADQEFGNYVASTSKDEIGQLVNSVNAMALTLSTSIDDLNASNALLEKELSKERSLEDMRRRFISDVSHELRNPISMIIGYADGIERGIAKNMEDRKYYAHVIKEEGKRMNLLVTDLLDISSYASGTFRMTKTDVDVAELIRTVLGKYTKIAGEKAVTVEMTGVYTAIIQGDVLRLEQVFTNLLDNAYKHVDKNGKISVSVDRMSEKVKIVIANTGDLIPEAALEDIWESFYQVDTDAEGNGLGLTIVKSIVELHHGKIQVYVSDKMNHFEVTL